MLLTCLALALPLTAALPQSRSEEPTAPFKADLRVDTNRDGKVDLECTTDVDGKDTWSETSGALFLPNIGETSRHCGGSSGCHDASTTSQWAPQYMAPMRTVPMPNISDSTTATISISDKVARENVRIFLDYPGRVAEINFADLASGNAPPPQENDRWVYLENDTPIAADKLREGLVLGIDARDTRRPGGWDGRVSVEFKVTDGSRSSSDKAMLRVAPVLTQHHLQPVEKVFVTKKALNDDEMTKAMERVQEGIQKNMQRVGITEPLNRLDIEYTWAQDVMEPAYASIPGPSGPITLRIHIAGLPVFSGATERTENLLFQDLRGEGMGSVRTGPAIRKNRNLEAGGNVESIPPYTLNGKRYPAGRIVLGATDEQTPQVLAYLQAQETQDPITLDTTWLFVQHVDEVLGFLPSAMSSHGWRLAILDPMMGYEALSKLAQDGHGDVPLTSRPTAQNATVPTVREFLAHESTKKAAIFSADKMEQALNTLKQETGITDEDVVRIPAVIATLDSLSRWLHVRKNNGPSAEGQEERSLPLNSVFPSQVNGVPLSDSVFMAPKPWGPVVDGEDIIEKMSREAYAKAGFDVDFIDDWELHLASGDLHCYTNTYRTPSPQWW